MKLISLSVKNFRGITDQSIEFADGITIVAGQNEAGKSSLIEAFDLLLRLKDGSRSQDILQAQPVGRDVGPEVEAEFIISDDHVRYRKRWMIQKETVLEFVSGPRRGKSLTAGAAHDAAEELWKNLDTHLWNASRLMQATALEQSALDASTSLQRALDSRSGGTVDDMTSGPLIEKVTAEADIYYTPTRTEKKILKDAQARVEAAKLRVVEAEASTDEIAGLIETLTELEDSIADREKSIASETSELTALAARAEAAQKLQAEVDEAGRKTEAAQRSFDEAKQKAEARTVLITTAEKAEIATAELKEKQEKFSADLAPLDEAAKESAEHLAAVKTKLAKVKKELAAARLFDRQRQTRLDVDRLTAQLSEYEKLSSEIAALESTIITVDAGKLDTITALEQKIAIAEAAARAGAAQLRIDSLDGTQKVLVNGSDTSVDKEPHEVPVLSELAIEVPGRLRFTITPAAGDEDTRRDLSRLKDEFIEALNETGHSSSAELKAALVKYNEDSAKLERTKERRADRLEGRSAEDLRDELAKHQAWLETQTDAAEGDIDALSELQDEYEIELETAQAILVDRQGSCSKLRTDLAGITGQVTNQEAVLTGALEDLEKAREAASDDTLEEAVAESEKSLASANENLSTVKGKLDDSGGAAVISDHALQVRHVQGLRDILADEKGKKAVTTGILDSKNRDDIQLEFDNAITELERAEAENVSLQARAKAALLLEQVLLKHQEATRSRYIEPFRDSLRELGRATYQDQSFDVEVAQDLTVSDRFMGGKLIPFRSLSTGAREQMAILIRLATASLVSADDAVPVFFDDTLGYSDRRRLHRVVEAISSSDRQIIIFTANEDRFAGLTNAHRVQL